MSHLQFSKIDIATDTKIYVTSFENKDIRKNKIFRIYTTTRLSKALVFTVNTVSPHKFLRSFLDCMPQLFLDPNMCGFQ